jgi:hypothetical protein
MSDEPSAFAQQLMAEIVAGREVTLSERELFRLSEYERSALGKAAGKRGYTEWRHEALRAIRVSPPTPSGE